MFQYGFLVLIVVFMIWRLIRTSYTDFGLPLRQAIVIGLIRGVLYTVTIVVMALSAFWTITLLPSSRLADVLVPLLFSLLGMCIAILVDRRVRTAVGNKAKDT